MSEMAVVAAVTLLERTPHRGMITACIICATLLQSLDQTIANVALPYMQGSFSASYDEITWVLTTYITAAAIMTAPVGWLAARFGRKRLFVDLHHRLHHHLDAVRRGAVAGTDRRVPPDAGRVQRRPGAAVAGDPVRHLSGGAARFRHGGLGHGRDDRPDPRPDTRRLSDRDVQLALRVLHQPAVRRCSRRSG